MANLEGKLALVTGGSRGIGQDICLALAEAGADIACVATNADNAANTVAKVTKTGQKAMAFGARVEQVAAIEKLFSEVEAKMGVVDILINNAGVAAPQSILEVDEAAYDRLVDINQKGLFFCARRAASAMIAQAKGGVIINIGSIAGENAIPLRSTYCATKAAVHHLTRVMALEWADNGIRVNCVAPGYIRTDIVQGLIDRGVLDKTILEGRIPQKRLGEGRDVAEAVCYLAGDGAAYVTGSILTVDGGWDAYGFI